MRLIFKAATCVDSLRSISASFRTAPADAFTPGALEHLEPGLHLAFHLTQIHGVTFFEALLGFEQCPADPAGAVSPI